MSHWGSWGWWSVCSKTCGGGISFRRRQCFQAECPHSIYKNCNGNDHEEKKCNYHCCPGYYADSACYHKRIVFFIAPIKFRGTPLVSYNSVKIYYIVHSV